MLSRLRHRLATEIERWTPEPCRKPSRSPGRVGAVLDISRGRWPCGRGPPVTRRTPFAKKRPSCLCVSLGPDTEPPVGRPAGLVDMSKQVGLLGGWILHISTGPAGPVDMYPPESVGICFGIAYLTSGLNRKLKSKFKFWLVLGRFPAKLGLKIHLNGSRSKNGAERSEIHRIKPIIMPFRNIFCSTVKTKI